MIFFLQVPDCQLSLYASAALSVDKHSLDHFCNKESSLVESVIMGTVLTLNHLNNIIII